MKAIHVNWTEPFFNRNRLRGYGFSTTREITSDTYDAPDYQLLYTVLSALRWKLHNGPIKLYTDTAGFNLYNELGFLDVYDEVDVEFLNNLPSVDPALFWTSGKIQSLSNETAPFIFLDQDFIIRDTIPDSFYIGDIGIGHWEIPRGYYYFSEEQWKRDIKHIDFPSNYNTNSHSPNTSLLYFSNNSIIEEYVEWHKKMILNNGDVVPEWFWLASDQGILGHVIREGKYETSTLTDKVFLADNDYGDTSTRKFGYSEQWYYPTESDISKSNLNWEHVWGAKVMYGLDSELLKRDTQRFFDEVVMLGGEKYLQHFRFSNYHNKY